MATLDPRHRRRSLPFEKARLALMCLVASAFIFLFVLRPSLDFEKEEDERTYERAMTAGLLSYSQDVQRFLMQDAELAGYIRARQFRKVTPIERVAARDLSFADFYNLYEVTGRPVVITNITAFQRPWSREHIRKTCPKAKVKPAVPNPVPGESWGNLDKLPAMSLGAFLDELEGPTPTQLYMHDWGIPKKCPKLLADYVVPKYFVQDYLRKTEDDPNTFPYRDSWPSLFLGKAGTGSGLHIDSGDTHFVMHMLQGVKDFRLIRRKDRIVAYEDRMESTFFGDLFNPNFTDHPLLALAEVFTARLEKDDLLFVPAGSAHQVVNPTDAMSISTNYVDASNVERSIMQFEQQADYDIAENLRKGAQSKWRTRMNPEPLPWARFKAT
ncbi:F-box protein [Diplonema papillatum]|nr:F-box protein [Diplonema papillatum]